ncbi:MAG: hypothetical protein LBT62_03970 [Deltaproteobacteria bacterium]|jgi:nicotinamide-nucleotide amidase|nr:hypothetical protein [Deltaproteobacteria bacterium]
MPTLPSKRLTSAVLSTGSELMLGQMTDTNSSWISAYLSSMGIDVVKHVSVGDDFRRLRDIFRDCFANYNVTLVTGGLGPTEDDLTRLAAARAFGLDLEYRTDLAEHIQQYLSSRNYNCSANNLRQAWLPTGATLIPNPWGTAPCFLLEDENSLMIFMPGVPLEMKNLVENYVKPKINEKFPSYLGIVQTTIVRAAGLGESLVDDRLGDLIRSSTNPSIGLLAGIYETRVLVTVRAKNQAQADQLQIPMIQEIKTRLGEHYVGIHPETLVSAACSLIAKKGLHFGFIDTITSSSALAPFLESLSPQYMAGALTIAEGDIDGALEYFFNKLKTDMAAVITGSTLESNQAGQTKVKASFRLIAKGAQNGSPKEISRVDRDLTGVKEALIARVGSHLAYSLWSWLKKEGEN